MKVVKSVGISINPSKVNGPQLRTPPPFVILINYYCLPFPWRWHVLPFRCQCFPLVGVNRSIYRLRGLAIAGGVGALEILEYELVDHFGEVALGLDL